MVPPRIFFFIFFWKNLPLQCTFPTNMKPEMIMEVLESEEESNSSWLSSSFSSIHHAVPFFFLGNCTCQVITNVITWCTGGEQCCWFNGEIWSGFKYSIKDYSGTEVTGMSNEIINYLIFFDYYFLLPLEHRETKMQPGTWHWARTPTHYRESTKCKVICSEDFLCRAMSNFISHFYKTMTLEIKRF